MSSMLFRKVRSVFGISRVSIIINRTGRIIISKVARKIISKIRL